MEKKTIRREGQLEKSIKGEEERRREREMEKRK